MQTIGDTQILYSHPQQDTQQTQKQNTQKS